MITAPATRPEIHTYLKAPRCRVITTFDDLESLAEEWGRLWALDPGKEIFQHFGWTRAWIRAFAKHNRLVTPVIYDSEDIIAILPLVECRQELRFIGHSVSDYNSFLCVPEFAREALSLALDTLFSTRPRRWKTVVLENVRADADLSQSLAELPARWQCLIQRSRPTPCPTLIFDNAKEQLIAGILSKDKVKKTCKAILRLGDLRFRHLETAADIRSHMTDFIQQHVSRCFLDGRQSQFLKTDYTSFYKYLIEELDPTHEIRFSVLELSGKPVAYHLGFEVDGRYLFYKPTFDIDLWDQSPGQVLLFRLLESFRASDVREFDLGQGGEPYKYRYSNLCRNNLTFKIYAPGIAGRTRRTCRQVITAARGRARFEVDRRPTLQLLCTRFATAAHAWRRRGGLNKLTESRLYALPSSTRAPNALELQPITLRLLAEHAAYTPGLLTNRDVQLIRERLKKGSTIYASKEWRHIILASPAASGKLPPTSADLPDQGLIFRVLYGADADRPALIRALAGIATHQGVTGWLVSDRPEPTLTCRATPPDLVSEG
jgi:CelD/BcsL family acetyltransferase involved in cellulose biosynthesis